MFFGTENSGWQEFFFATNTAFGYFGTKMWSWGAG